MAKTTKQAKTKTTAKTVARKVSAPKVDVVEEVKIELDKAAPAAPKKKVGRGLSWGILLLVILVIFGAQFLIRYIRLQKLKTELPAVITELGGGMTLKDLRDWTYKGGVWEFKIVFEFSGEETEFVSYVSEDGKTLFTSGIDLAEFKNEIENGGAAAAGGEEMVLNTAVCESTNKADNATLDAYVVSQCPYGLQMQRAIATAIAEAPELASQVKVRYIGEIVEGEITAMHGEEEAQENLRQICLREEQADKYWPYVSCYMQAGDAEGCLTSTSVNTTSLDACMTNGAGLEYAQVDFDMANEHGVTGSPSMVVNNLESVSEYDFGGRSAEAIKQIVCCSSTTAPAFCEQALTTDQAAVSYSAEVTSDSATTAASC